MVCTVVPFILLLIGNIVIIIQFSNINRSHRTLTSTTLTTSEDKQLYFLTTILLTITSAHLLLTLPNAIYMLVGVTDTDNYVLFVLGNCMRYIDCQLCIILYHGNSEKKSEPCLENVPISDTINMCMPVNQTHRLLLLLTLINRDKGVFNNNVYGSKIITNYYLIHGAD